MWEILGRKSNKRKKKNLDTATLIKGHKIMRLSCTSSFKLCKGSS